MGFEAGKSGNPAGRPKGAKGQTPATVKAAIAEALESRSHEIAAKLDAVTDPAKWLELYAKFAVFIIPKNAKIETQNHYEDMTDDELLAQLDEMDAQAGVKRVPIAEWERLTEGMPPRESTA